jgi:hypothetical protein
MIRNQRPHHHRHLHLLVGKAQVPRTVRLPREISKPISRPIIAFVLNMEQHCFNTTKV